MPAKFQGRSALVTGASSGLGEAFGRALAARGMDVFLTALPSEQDRLSEIASELGSRHHVRAECGAVDLSERDGARRLQTMADESAFEPDLLVNSAGVGAVGALATSDLDSHLRQIPVNVEALAALTGLYLPRMVGRRSGAVINIASTAGLDPVPNMAVYSASKAFVLRLSEALWAENHRHGVRVLAVCSGPFESRILGSVRADSNTVPERGRRKSLEVDDIVAASMVALHRDRPRVVLRVKSRAGVGLVRQLARALPSRPSLILRERLTRCWFEKP